jgi:hypothetical protein
MPSLDQLEYFTYPEYKLYCLKNRIKPLKKSKIGCFIAKKDIAIQNNDFSKFDPRIEMIFDQLSVENKIESQKVNEISKKICFYDVLNCENVTFEDFVNFFD